MERFRERHPSTTSQVSLDEQIDFLQEKLYVIQSQSSGGCARKRKEKSLRRELSALKRQIRNERKVSGEWGGVSGCQQDCRTKILVTGLGDFISIPTPLISPLMFLSIILP